MHVLPCHPQNRFCRTQRLAKTHDEGAGQSERQGGWLDHADNLTVDMAVQAAEIVPEADWKQNDSVKWVLWPACNMHVACSMHLPHRAHPIHAPAGTKCRILVITMSTGGLGCS